jgi:hypothetical protein
MWMFSSTYQHTKFMGPILSGASVHSAAEVRTAAMLVLFMVNSYKGWRGGGGL